MRDYSNHPESLTERRAEEDDNAFRMNPRDALIMALRKYDAGEFGNVDTVIVCIRDNQGQGHTTSHFTNAGPDLQTSVGLLETVKMKMWNN